MIVGEGDTDGDDLLRVCWGKLEIWLSVYRQGLKFSPRVVCHIPGKAQCVGTYVL